MSLIANLKPRFWGHASAGAGYDEYRFNLRKIWKLMVMLTLGVSLLPLVVMAVVDYQVTQRAAESEILLRTSRVVSNARRTVSYFLIERKAALDFINQSDSFESVFAPGRLASTLNALQASFGGFVDLGVINEMGFQSVYTGPYELLGKDYGGATFFREARDKDMYISDVFMGFRNVPHMVIAVRHRLPGGGYYVLRATLDTQRFNELLSGLDLVGEGDAFVINRDGVLQTRSRYYGDVLGRIPLPVPKYAEKTQVEVIQTARGPMVMGYAYIPDSPFILMIFKQKGHLMASWGRSRTQIAVFVIISGVSILFVLLGGITYMVNQIFLAEQSRLTALHKAEYANKLASLGRLSAGVAHEINNPLAIINEKAGLIKDLFTFREDYRKDAKLMGLVDSVLSSVERCAGITRRLLNFARPSELTIRPVNLKALITEVLSFMEKEAQYRSVQVDVRLDGGLPEIQSDPGRLQEIFLNLISNAFGAVQDGGRLEIAWSSADGKWVTITVSDNGHGIPEADLEHIFEPFFSTKTGQGGTGLGLSITYRLTQELGGRIGVESRVGHGTTFTVRLPVNSAVSDAEAMARVKTNVRRT